MKPTRARNILNTKFRRFFYLLLVLLPVTCEKKQEITGDERIRAILTKGYGEWGPPGIDWGYAADFATPGKTKWRFVGEGIVESPMRYGVSQGKIRIEILPEALMGANTNLLDTVKPVTVCSLLELPDSLEYLYELKCDNKLKLYSGSHRVIGLPRKVAGYAIITTGGYKAEITEPVKFRSAPSPDAPTISCSFPDRAFSDGRTITSDVLRYENARIFVLGRTPEKATVQKWRNYWLYVMVSTDIHDGESCQNNYGWLFGEFIRPDKRYLPSG